MRVSSTTGLYIPGPGQSVGSFLQKLLTKSGATQSELGDRIDVSRQTVNNILCDRTSLTPYMAVRLQAVLGCDAVRLLKRQAEAEVAAIPKNSYNRLTALLTPKNITALKPSKERTAKRQKPAEADW